MIPERNIQGFCPVWLDPLDMRSVIVSKSSLYLLLNLETTHQSRASPCRFYRNHSSTGKPKLAQTSLAVTHIPLHGIHLRTFCNGAVGWSSKILFHRSCMSPPARLAPRSLQGSGLRQRCCRLKWSYELEDPLRAMALVAWRKAAAHARPRSTRSTHPYFVQRRRPKISRHRNNPRVESCKDFGSRSVFPDARALGKTMQPTRLWPQKATVPISCSGFFLTDRYGRSRRRADAIFPGVTMVKIWRQT